MREKCQGTLAHLGERTTEDRKVRGSSPRSPMKFFFFFEFGLCTFWEVSGDAAIFEAGICVVRQVNPSGKRGDVECVKIHLFL